MYWSHSLNDLKTLVRLRTQHELAKSYHLFESLRIVVHEALGGSTKEETPSDSIQTFAEMKAAFSALGGKVAA